MWSGASGMYGIFHVRKNALFSEDAPTAQTPSKAENEKALSKRIMKDDRIYQSKKFET